MPSLRGSVVLIFVISISGCLSPRFDREHELAVFHHSQRCFAFRRSAGAPRPPGAFCAGGGASVSRICASSTLSAASSLADFLAPGFAPGLGAAAFTAATSFSAASVESTVPGYATEVDSGGPLKFGPRPPPPRPPDAASSAPSAEKVRRPNPPRPARRPRGQ